MTRDKALKLVQALLHDLRHGNQPYLSPQDAEEVLRHIDAIREEQK